MKINNKLPQVIVITAALFLSVSRIAVADWEADPDEKAQVKAQTAIALIKEKVQGIETYFDGRLTTEGLNIYKPHPRTYHWVSNEVGEPIGNCMLIAAHGWDVAGATITGMRSAFVERPGKTLYPLGPDIELKGKDLSGYHKLNFTLYSNHKNDNAVHPEGSMWIDDVIVSQVRPSPLAGSGTTDFISPAAPTDFRSE